MSNKEENALMVNAIQRCASVVVQNSLQEGFGLTATEAMVKGVAFIGTAQACGLRAQVRHGIDGLLVQGNAADYRNVAKTINAVLGNDWLRQYLAVNGKKRAFDNFLSYKQREYIASDRRE
jgi:trehalose synthase